MNAALRTLLERSIDYAGLFPPASLGIEEALREYHALRRGPEAWIVNRFIAKTDQVADLGETEQLPLALVAAAPEGQVRAAINQAIETAIEHRAGSLELRVPGSLEVAKEAASTARRHADELSECQIYLEFPWGDELTDWLSEALSAWEEVGFKARTGGVTADAFPTPEQLAVFIHEVASLEAPFKFTAGLHQPIRYLDEGLGVHRHGFLNVLGASALAFSAELTRAEIEAILSETDSNAFGPAGSDFRIAGHNLSPDDASMLHNLFGGIGSCSVAEPLDALDQHGWLGPAGVRS